MILNNTHEDNIESLCLPFLFSNISLLLPLTRYDPSHPLSDFF